MTQICSTDCLLFASLLLDFFFFCSIHYQYLDVAYSDVQNNSTCETAWLVLEFSMKPYCIDEHG